MNSTLRLLWAGALLTFATAAASAQVSRMGNEHRVAPQAQAQLGAPTWEHRPQSPPAAAAAVIADTVFVEDFSDSLSGWTVISTIPADTALWSYSTADSIFILGANRDRRVDAEGNGYAVINYSVSGDTIPTYSQGLLSPVMDLSAYDAEEDIVTLTFTQFFAYIGVNGATLSFTTDGGQTYTDSIVINEGLPGNTFAPAANGLELPAELYGEDSVQVSFNYDMADYAWAVDDILVLGDTRPLPPVASFDFANGFEGWEVTSLEPDTALWQYSTVDTLRGRFTSGNVETPGIAASTENGYALLNYDFYNTGGIAIDSFATGPVAQYLVSPSFSTEGVEQGLAVQLYTSFRFCCNAAGNAAFLNYSVDGGETFSDEPIQVHPNAVVNDLFRGNILVNLPQDILGFPDVKLRFEYTGEFYYWLIDDVAVLIRPDDDLTVNSNFFAVAPNYSTPQEIAENAELRFLADITNKGGLAQDDVQLVVLIDDTSGVMIYTDTLDYGTIASDSIAENKAFPEGFPMPTELGTYTATYKIISPDEALDANFDDNTLSFEFEVTEGLYAKQPAFTGGSRPGGNPSTFELGNIYTLPNTGDTVRVDSIELGFFLDGIADDGDAETIMDVLTYGFLGDLNDDGLVTLGQVDDEGAELVELVANTITLDTSAIEADGDYEFVITPTESGEGVTFVAGDPYIGFGIGLLYTTANTQTPDNNSFFMGSGPVDYGAYGLAIDTLELFNRRTNYIISEESEEPVLQAGYDVFGAGWWINAFVNIDTTTTPTNVIELSEAEFRLFPNPASTSLTVEYDFAEAATEATITIVNAVGQVARTIRRSDVGSGRFEIPTTGLNNGLYYVGVSTDAGERAMRKVYIVR